MNILYINRDMDFGGLENCILKLCKLFNTGNNKIVVASTGGELVKNLATMNITHYTIKSTESKTPTIILQNLIKIYTIITHEKIDIIHSHHRMTSLLAKAIVKITKTRLLHTQHLCIDDKFRLTHLSLNNIKIIAVSNAAKRILIEKVALKKSNITTIYNTIETECHNNPVDNKLLALKEKGFFIAAQISRMFDYKGVYDFIAIAKSTSLENNNIKFVLIGDGPELKNIREIIKSENLEELIYILGVKSNIIDHLKHIDLLLLCSYIEGLPLAPLEAFSQGIPVIATNIDGTNEEIINEYNGYLVNIKDVEGFKNKILDLYKDKAKYLSMQKNCKETFNSNFNQEKYFKSHLKLYKELLN